jgi:hypothetical protein
MGIMFFMNGMLCKFTLDELKWGHVNVGDSSDVQFQNHKYNPSQEALFTDALADTTHMQQQL